MKPELLKEIRKNKYNDWGKKDPIVSKDQKVVLEALSFADRHDLSTEEKSIYYLYKLTKCKGFEFVLYSNAHLVEPIFLSEKVVIYPCFRDTSKGGGSFNDPYYLESYKMYQNNQYIYDGWISIDDFSEENVRNTLEELKSIITIFSITTNCKCKIISKYDFENKNSTTCFIDSENLNKIELLTNKLYKVNIKDRNAIFHSLGWLANGITVEDCELKFLSYMLAIESLCYFIEEKSDKDKSIFKDIRGERLSKKERREKRKECIQSKLDLIDENSDLRTEIETIYFDCINGSGNRLREHLRRILGECKIDLFDGSPSLYKIRNNLAHGTHNLLNEENKILLKNNISNIKILAEEYIFLIIKTTVLEEKLEIILNCKGSGSPNIVISDRNMYSGPTDLYILYNQD